ncbi:nuclear transport factor 2 family protein [Mycolicibacterium smegmatis]|jgi:hypothetical protein|uniref:SnoaL-like domain-containing protein n=3 Tax=Mycolicibacterium smegmatis TaxID=1772 RepID=I7FM20_MYCS2|nr:nuclear transport factor 2 family protein [Mycolicibacterium smegmatis]ABK72226.1 hypothetical protein MSMEG_3385 [Mycolicibacterium smegmatis MC2 155]AFP39768.1 hypothetical protein MSMEI_3305 [Mycolicibacterium smegmatis MC2 155]AIU08527.1 hypothetical protein LJ00_16845 [Mycolicibacterium smegmatis MC2 155]AIU15152.1 hypothetical protein LI99_16850 [Mycolicibacterium smegmatis]AIU21775.1 hypothetical protein LI98_16855 [Mycolicibacterium smegmatis]
MTTSAEQSHDAATETLAGLRAFVSQWVTDGWHLERGETFNFRRLLDSFYDWDSADVLLHDNADPDRALCRSAASYAAIWDRTLTKLVALDNTIIDGPHVAVSGDLAVADVCFRSRFEFDNGDVEVVPTRSSLALRRHGNRWCIFREHGSALSPEHQPREQV